MKKWYNIGKEVFYFDKEDILFLDYEIDPIQSAPEFRYNLTIVFSDRQSIWRRGEDAKRLYDFLKENPDDDAS